MMHHLVSVLWKSQDLRQARLQLSIWGHLVQTACAGQKSTRGRGQGTRRPALDSIFESVFDQQIPGDHGNILVDRPQR